ncbi:exopolysaccharide biosynthesis polyprenyl glycosylphosphotransferase [Ancylobacter terrae]|uniref:exopolysaccharide biosynthesis polyprenyl glycosylphosphotransferase n=1 Tax=Ancylobacter sp. sgz301288 TaxID=3342077 RepID=UPI003859364D
MVGAAFVDFVVIALAAVIGAALRQGDLGSVNWIQSIGVLFPTYFFASIAFGGYSIRRLASLPRSCLVAMEALGVAVVFGLCAAFALQVGARFSRLETTYTVVFAAGFLILARIVGSVLMRRVLRIAIEPVIVVIGDGKVFARRSPGTMTTVLDVRKADLSVDLANPAFFDRVAGLVRNADRVVITLDDDEERLKWAEAMRLSGIDAEIIADLGDIQPLGVSRWQSHPTLVISRGPMTLGERILKRGFDLFVTLAMMPFWAPVIAIAAVAVKLDSPGPAFFVQERTGRNNRGYRCFKLRTMKTEQLDTSGHVSASRTDSRITKLGRILRKTSVDELPQLVNVLLGDMSLVGPRPHALGSRAEGALFWELVPDYWSRHAMKPGVTGLAQVRGLRGATHHRSDIERRVAADLEYINSWSLWLDVKILFRTLAVAIHRNAY